MKKDPQAAARAVLRASQETGSRGLRMAIRAVQAELNWVPPEVLEMAAAHFGLELPQAMEIAALTPGISLEPQGETVIEVCRGLACSDAHSADVLAAAEKCLGMAADSTRADGKITLKRQYCFGRCAIGPNVRINQEIYSNQDPSSIVEEINRLRQNGRL